MQDAFALQMIPRSMPVRRQLVLTPGYRPSLSHAPCNTKGPGRSRFVPLPVLTFPHARRAQFVACRASAGCIERHQWPLPAPPVDAYPLQSMMMQKAHERLQRSGRVTLDMPCGTGKTLVGLWVAELSGVQRIVVFVPTITLVRQALRDWRDKLRIPWKQVDCLCVCSDDGEAEETVQVTTDRQMIADYLQDSSASAGRQDTDRIQLVFCTYKSSRTLGEAQHMAAGHRFDLGIFDEAHHTVTKHGGEATPALFDTHHAQVGVSIQGRLFMTATTKKSKQDDVYSMDDKAVYGEILKLSSEEAVEAGLNKPFKVIAHPALKANSDATIDDATSKAGFKRYYQANAITAAIEKYAIKNTKGLLYFSTIREAHDFKATAREVPGLPNKVPVLTGKLNSQERNRVLEDFLDSAEGALLCSCQALQEGVNLPGANMVVFMDPKRSHVAIIQVTKLVLMHAFTASY
mmetsp:Transcript_9514/g.16353  ORF Transcript_9514/g.16353 Transcript_9514/m.16353 type:complete len:461 (+) Transcript_9514:273-1655(+)